MSTNSQNQANAPNAPAPLAIPRAGWSTGTRPASMFPPSPTSPTTSQLASSLVNFGTPPTPGSPPVFSRRLSYNGGGFNFQDPFPSLSSPVSTPPVHDPAAPTHARSRSATLPSILTTTIPSFSTSARSASITSPTLEKVREEDPPLVRGWFRRAQSDSKKREKSPMRDAILTGQFLD